MNQTKGHPKGLYLLFVTEMWERFSYYGMRALFMLYMVQALLFDKEMASQVYLTPLIGGYIADRYWGNRRSIVVGALTMALGQFLLFLSACYFQEVALAKYLMFCGLGLLILGNGFFKPNISTMVGRLYTPDDNRKDSAFTIFYMGVNVGSTLAPLGNYQRMSFHQRIDVKKRIKIGIFGYLVARNFARNDFTEYCCHIV